MKISIITVVYNARSNLKKTLDSIKLQTCKKIEYIVVDGGSTDGSLELLNAHKDMIDVFISEPDNGLYYAMNKGKDLATGDFAIFINAGDIFAHKDSINNIEQAMTEKELFYHGNTIIYFDNTFKIAPETHHQSVFFPKSFYSTEDYNVNKYEITAEADYIFRAINKHPKKHIDVDIIYSRIDGFRVHCYNSISGMKKIYGEVTELMKEHNKSTPTAFKLTYPLKSLLKYIAFKTGGLPLVAKLLLISYKNSDRYYYIEND